MAKKILYKVTAYHCPRCGGITEPSKRYCEYCERELGLRRLNKNKMRLIVDYGEYVYFDAITNIITTENYNTIEATTLGDSCRKMISSPVVNRTMEVTFNMDERGRELLKLGLYKIKRIRLENIEADIGYEQDAYLGDMSFINPTEQIILGRMRLIGYGKSEIGRAIPQEVMKELRCPNCGAPIKSRYGACDYCSGWSEIAW